MAITSVGYAGTVGDVQWANMVPRVGSAFYSVDDAGSFKVTAAAGTRTVQVAAGGAQSFGVYAVSDGPQTFELDSVASGVRWDMIVLRRNWATKATTIAVIQGGSTKALPPRTVTPGTLVDQPLGLVRLAAGSTSIQEIADVRCSVHNGGAVGWDDLVRSYLNQMGTVLRIGDTVWYRVTDGAGSPAWISSDMSDTGWVSVPTGLGWESASGYPLEVRAIGPGVQLRGALSAKTAQASVLNLGVIPELFRPSRSVFLGAYHGGYSSSGNHVGELLLTAAGLIYVPPLYYDGSLGIGGVVPVHGNWFRG